MADDERVETPADNPTEYATAVGEVEPVVDPEPGDAPEEEEAEDEEQAEPVPRPRRRTSKILVAGRVLLGLVSAVALAAMTLVYLRVDELDNSKNTTDAIAQAQSGPNVPAAQEDDD